MTGFEAGFDVRNVPNTTVELGGLIFFGNVHNPGGQMLFPSNVAYAETIPSAAQPLKDDDNGFNELGVAGYAVADPELLNPFNADALEASPRVPLSSGAMAPPNDGFFSTTATYVGAFRDRTDTWATGRWVVWAAR